MGLFGGSKHKKPVSSIEDTFLSTLQGGDKVFVTEYESDIFNERYKSTTENTKIVDFYFAGDLFNLEYIKSSHTFTLATDYKHHPDWQVFYVGEDYFISVFYPDDLFNETITVFTKSEKVANEINAYLRKNLKYVTDNSGKKHSHTIYALDKKYIRLEKYL